MPFFNTIASGANIVRVPILAHFIDGLEERFLAKVIISDILILSADVCDIHLRIVGQPGPTFVRLIEKPATSVPTYELKCFA